MASKLQETHVEISLDKNEFVTYLDFAMPLKMSEAGDPSGTATLVLDLDSEPSKQHSGDLRSAEVTVRAALDTAGVPGADILLNAVKGCRGSFVLG